MVNLVYLVNLVCLVYLVYLVYSVYSVVRFIWFIQYKFMEFRKKTVVPERNLLEQWLPIEDEHGGGEEARTHCSHSLFTPYSRL
jgi:hypothetical protein